jgi:hypothetical protein
MSMYSKLLLSSAVIGVMGLCPVFAQQDTAMPTQQMVETAHVSNWFQPHVFGYGNYQYGQIVHGQYAHLSDGNLDHFSMEQAVVQVGGEINSKIGLSAVVIGQGVLSFPLCLPSDGSGAGGFGCYTPFYSWNLKQAELQYTLGDAKSPILKFGVGLFPFKYNPDGRTFGDYLLRISPYPQFLQTSFDVPDAEHMLGLHVGSSISPWSPDQLALRQDLMLTSETTLWPLQDFSLTYMFNSTIFNFLDLGAGIMWDRLFPTSAILDKPDSSNNTHNFTFQGTKVMLRAALDFKNVWPLNLAKGLWGKEDWRLYSEMCLNGLKDYPVTDTNSHEYPGYNDITKRTPTVFGFHVPTCKILDVLSLEWEWWDNNFANSYYGVFNAGYGLVPNPYKYAQGNTNRNQPYGGPWHWGIYAKKTVFTHISLVGQIGRDHTFIQTSMTGTSNGDPQEAMDGLGNWAWWLKVQYDF